MDKVTKRVHDIIIQHISAKTNTPPKFGFVQIKNRRIWYFSHSLKSNPDIMSDKYVQMHWGDFRLVFFLLYRFRLVLKATYLI